MDRENYIRYTYHVVVDAFRGTSILIVKKLSVKLASCNVVFMFFPIHAIFQSVINDALFSSFF